MKKRLGMVASLWVCLLLGSLNGAQGATTDSWPKEITSPQWMVVIYQPQPEKLEGNELDARAAVSVELKGSAEPVFGAVWFKARLDTDRSERTATITDVSITHVRFPEQDDQKSKKLVDLLEHEIPKWQMSISMDRLLTTLELVEQRAEVSEKINTDPPKILFVPEPAVLISLDGEPRLKKEENSELMRVINTPFTLLFMPSKKHTTSMRTWIRGIQPRTSKDNGKWPARYQKRSPHELRRWHPIQRDKDKRERKRRVPRPR